MFATELLASLAYIVRTAVITVIVLVVVLMLLRLIVNYADFNPFSKPVMLMRRITDPLVQPVRYGLMNFGISPNLAPLIAILLTILVGYFVVSLSNSIFGTLAGIIISLQTGAPVKLIGYVLYGLLDVFGLLIVIRIIFSWGASYGNRVMRFLARVTDPILLPLRRMIPPFGPFDLSPLIALIAIWIFQAAIQGTLIRG